MASSHSASTPWLSGIFDEYVQTAKRVFLLKDGKSVQGFIQPPDWQGAATG